MPGEEYSTIPAPASRRGPTSAAAPRRCGRYLRALWTLPFAGVADGSPRTVQYTHAWATAIDEGRFCAEAWTFGPAPHPVFGHERIAPESCRPVPPSFNQ